MKKGRKNGAVDRAARAMAEFLGVSVQSSGWDGEGITNLASWTTRNWTTNSSRTSRTKAMT